MATSRVVETNQYLADPEKRARLVFRSAQSSSAVEGIREAFESERVRGVIHEKRKTVRFTGPRIKES